MLIGSQRSGGTGDEDVEAIHARNGSLFWSSTDLKQWSYSVALQPEVASKTAGETQRGVAGFGCPFSGHAAGTPPPPPLVLGFWADAGGSASAPDWQITIPNSTQNSGVGPPKAVFSADGKTIIVIFHGDQSFDGQDIEYMGVIPVDSPTGVPMVPILLGSGYGHTLKVLRPTATTDPAAAASAKPAPTLALVTRTNMSYSGPNQIGEVNEHFVMSYGVPGSPVVIASTPIIDCNRTGDCDILASSADLSTILVSVGGQISAHFPDTALCKFEVSNPWRWGVALLVADGGGPDSADGDSGWPYAGYSLAWAKCSSDDDATMGKRKLASAHILDSSKSVVLTYTHMNGVVTGSGAAGIEACQYTSKPGGGDEASWCSAVYPISPPSTLGEATGTLLPSAVGDAGHIAVAIAGFGIVAVDFAATSRPAWQKVYEPASADDCCMPTDLDIVTTGLSTAGGGEATLVASIPNGKQNGNWCQCFGSKLVGVALPNAAPDTLVAP